MEVAESVVRTACRGCHGVCQVLVHLNSAGRVIRVTGDPDSPTSRGYICPKAQAAPEQLYHPDRITRPMRRTGPRGAGQWKAVSWDEALSEMTEVFDRVRRESGPEYVAMCQGTGRPYTEFAGRFLNAFGSPNFATPGHNCFVPRNIASAITMGWFPQPDIYGNGGRMPACILQYGQNTPDTGAADGYCGGMVRRALHQAKEVIVVDPRRTSSAASAGHHLQLRPASDCALVLAMLHVIIGERLYDAEFVERYCTGFEELAAHVLPFSPEWAEPITRVPAADLRSAARTFANVRPACVLWGNGIDMSINSFQTGRALLLLMAITGNLDVPGGMVQWVPPADIRPKSFMVDRSVAGDQFLTPAQKAKMIGAGRFPFAPGCHQPTFWEACVSGVPYRPRAMWLVGTNPLVTATRGDIIAAALREHMEFTVVSDFFFTPTAELADLVLPAAHWLEQDDVVYFHKIWCVLARRKVAQVGEARDDRAVILDLAHRLGLHNAFPWADWSAYLRWVLEPSGLSFEQFAKEGIRFGKMQYRKYETQGFHTPSGRIELVSSIMAKCGRPPLPVYVEPPVSPLSRPDLAKDYPLILITGCKVLPFFHSAGRQIPSLRQRHPLPLVDVHPATALRLALAEGSQALVETPEGQGLFYVHLDDRLAEDVVHVEHAWWYPERAGADHGWRESAANLLFGHEHFDPDSGAEALRGALCRVGQAASDSDSMPAHSTPLSD
jgi:anaerobic selenocysteine-containing dehydrogenase